MAIRPHGYIESTRREAETDSWQGVDFTSPPEAVISRISADPSTTRIGGHRVGTLRWDPPFPTGDIFDPNTVITQQPVWSPLPTPLRPPELPADTLLRLIETYSRSIENATIYGDAATRLWEKGPEKPRTATDIRDLGQRKLLLG